MNKKIISIQKISSPLFHGIWLAFYSILEQSINCAFNNQGHNMDNFQLSQFIFRKKYT